MADGTTAGPASAGPPATPELDRQGQDMYAALLRDRLLDEFRALASLPCPSGKQRHPEKKDALRHVTSLNRNRKNTGSKVTAYRCGLCGSWHAGRK